MKNILAFTLFITLALSACKKDLGTEPVDPNQLPPSTEIGANILACKVNGKAQVYSGIPITLDEKGVSFSKYNRWGEQSIEISASDSKYEDHIIITVYEPNWDIRINKQYNFSVENKVLAEYLLPNVITEFKTSQNSGYVIFTQYNDKIVAGKFSFKAYKLEMSDSVNITEGFFDISVSSTQ